MKYLLPSDLDMVIRTEHLDLTADAAVIDLCEAAAIEEMKGYMRGRYDMNLVFAPDNQSLEWQQQRSPLLVRHLLAMTLTKAAWITTLHTLPDFFFKPTCLSLAIWNWEPRQKILLLKVNFAPLRNQERVVGGVFKLRKDASHLSRSF